MNYLAYAGIGSRETPQHILNIMSHLGSYLCSEGWTLRSGGASGADQAFEVGVLQAETVIDAEAPPRKEIYLPWRGFNNSTSHLHPGNLPFTQQEIDFSAHIHPNWARCSPSAKLLHQRNLRQIIGCEALHGSTVIPVKFVVCWTENGQLKGGTAQAMRIANACGVPIINLGKAINAKELEALVLIVEQLQAAAKEPVVA